MQTIYFQWFHCFVFKYIFPLCLPVVSHSLQSKKKKKNVICGNHIHPSVNGLVAVYTKLLSRWWCSENHLTNIHNLLNGINEFVHILPYFLTDIGEVWYKRSPWSTCEYHKSWCSESLTLFKGVNEDLPLLPPPFWVGVQFK